MAKLVVWLLLITFWDADSRPYTQTVVFINETACRGAGEARKQRLEEEAYVDVTFTCELKQVYDF